MLAGITIVTNKKMLDLADRHENVLLNSVTTVAIGALAGWISIFIFTSLVALVGKWLKGLASSDDILTTAAYATFPAAFIILILDLICVVILRSRGFAKSYADIGLIDSGNINQMILRVNRYLGILLNLYYLFLLVNGISVIQGFTKGKAFLNLLLTILGVALILCLFITIPFLLNHSSN